MEMKALLALVIVPVALLLFFLLRERSTPGSGLLLNTQGGERGVDVWNDSLAYTPSPATGGDGYVGPDEVLRDARKFFGYGAPATNNADGADDAMAPGMLRINPPTHNLALAVQGIRMAGSETQVQT